MHFEYVLSLGDSNLILAQQLAKWCGHGPVLEQDIALSNLALDLLGQARNLLTHAAKLENLGRDEDQLAFFRDTHQYKNLLLVEQPNQNWGFTIVRQFFYDVFQVLNYEALLRSTDPQLAAIAEKAIKEVTYHQRFSSEWMIRLGDGTEYSHQKIQEAIDELWMFTGEMFSPSQADQLAYQSGIAPDLTQLSPQWAEKVESVLATATLQKPKSDWAQLGGKEGRHSENMGFILAEMQHLQRTYPGQKW